jgi:hypothetical protein
MDGRPTDDDGREAAQEVQSLRAASNIKTVQGPHQALFGYPPGLVHRRRDKTQLLEDYRRNVEKAKQRRRQERILKNQKLTTFLSGNV